jgi:preprotein translocase subunit SecY
LLIQYPKRQVGSRMFQGDTSHLPLKLNTAGVIPPIFASSLLLLPATLRGLFQYRHLPGWARPCWPRWATASRPTCCFYAA